MAHDPFDSLTRTAASPPRPSDRVWNALQAEIGSPTSSVRESERRPQIRWGSRKRRAGMSLLVLALLLLLTSRQALRSTPELLVLVSLVYAALGSLLLLAGGVPGHMQGLAPPARRGLTWFLPALVLVSLAA